MIKPFYYLIVISAILMFVPSSVAQVQPWFKLHSPAGGTLLNLCFVDSLTGWAAGESGTIIRTTNGGNIWEIQNSTVQSTISDIWFVDKNYGWALTLQDGFPFTSVIIKTTNGGNDWRAADFPDTTELLKTIFFFDSLNGFVGGSYIAYTSDGGNSWIEANIDSSLFSNFPVYNFSFLNRQFGYASGGRIDICGVVWRTTDYGLNWTSMGIGADEIYDVFIFDSLNAISLSGDPEGFFAIANLKTTDGGSSWGSEYLAYTGLCFAIDFRTYNEGWCASGYKFLLTTDRGETWTEFPTPDSTIVFDLQFTDARHGYASGENGTILKFDPSLVDVKSEPKIPDEFILYQNYPNPFNPTTSIQYAINSKQFVTLKVFDLLGREVATLVNEEKPVGEYEVEFDGTELPSGVYFYQLLVSAGQSTDGKAGSFIQTKKLLMIK